MSRQDTPVFYNKSLKPGLTKSIKEIVKDSQDEYLENKLNGSFGAENCDLHSHQGQSVDGVTEPKICKHEVHHIPS